VRDAGRNRHETSAAAARTNGIKMAAALSCEAARDAAAPVKSKIMPVTEAHHVVRNVFVVEERRFLSSIERITACETQTSGT